jgi:hypothetical protein
MMRAIQEGIDATRPARRSSAFAPFQHVEWSDLLRASSRCLHVRGAKGERIAILPPARVGWPPVARTGDCVPGRWPRRPDCCNRVALDASSTAESGEPGGGRKRHDHDGQQQSRLRCVAGGGRMPVRRCHAHLCRRLAWKLQCVAGTGHEMAGTNRRLLWWLALIAARSASSTLTPRAHALALREWT